MKELLLADAIGNIDDRLVEEYIGIKAERQKKSFSLKGITSKWALAAASFFFAIIIGVGVFLGITADNNEIIKINPNGKPIENRFGSIILTDSDYQNKAVTFILEKKNNAHLYIKFEGYMVLEEFVDENGILRKKFQQIDVITDYDGYKPDNGHKVLDIPIKMTVNGEEMEAIPREPGVYEITVDYSNLYNVLDYVDIMVEVRKFGNFKLD